MTIAYFDCFAGAGGDMIVGALLDAGCDFAALKAELDKLSVAGCTLRAETVRRGGLAGTQFCVEPPAEEPYRNLSQILKMIDQAGLKPRAADRAKRIFTRLAEAEAKVHHIQVDQVHFHEVGALDSIMDIVGACIALELLAVERVFCSPIPAGSGIFLCEHGAMPAPAPATAELLVGAKTASSDLAGELTTPTAAAVLTTLAESYGPLPSMPVKAVGYGAGARETSQVPNLLRVFLGELDESDKAGADTVIELSANIDDCTGETLGATLEKLLAAGCLDAWAMPIYMKKSRPAWMISVLCAETDAEAAERILFTETTTFGVRRRRMRRSKLSRQRTTVETAYGPIRIKIGWRGEEIMTASPEFADCQAAAEAHGVSVKEVLAAAETAYRQGRTE